MSTGANPALIGFHPLPETAECARPPGWRWFFSTSFGSISAYDQTSIGLSIPHQLSPSSISLMILICRVLSQKQSVMSSSFGLYSHVLLPAKLSPTNQALTCFHKLHQASETFQTSYLVIPRITLHSLLILEFYSLVVHFLHIFPAIPDDPVTA